MTQELTAMPILANGVQPYQEPEEDYDLGLDPGEAKPARLQRSGCSAAVTTC